MAYVYDDAGERVIKTGPQGETAYVNQFYVVRNREVATKHVFAGGSRLVSQLAGQPDENGVINTPTAGNSGQTPWGWTNGNGGGNGNGNAGGNGGGNGGGNSGGGAVFESDQYFYHPDHLGSSSYVTDIDGEIFQHVEYFPFGETFFQESSNTQRTPYLFTGKELDEETGLYYFGARYYDPRTSVWQSPDPILASYMQGKGSGGGVFAPVNLNLYGYVQQRPIISVDPNGLQTDCGFLTPATLCGAILGAATAGITAPMTHDGTLEEAGQINEGWRQAALDGATEGLKEDLIGAGVLGVGTRLATRVPLWKFWAWRRELSPDMGNFVPSHVQGAGAMVDSRLPARPGNSGATTGFIDTDNGVIFLRSGATGPGSQYIGNGPAMNYSGSHVEGHAAALMKEHGITNMTVTINHSGGPCGTCMGNSSSSVGAILPLGSTLNVRYMDQAGQIQTYSINGFAE